MWTETSSCYLSDRGAVAMSNFGAGWRQTFEFDGEGWLLTTYNFIP